jgi:hypothetical protein
MMDVKEGRKARKKKGRPNIWKAQGRNAKEGRNVLCTEKNRSYAFLGAKERTRCRGAGGRQRKVITKLALER